MRLLLPRFYPYKARSSSKCSLIGWTTVAALVVCCLFMLCNLTDLLWSLDCIYCIVQNGGGGNFGEFGESKAIRQSFTHPNLHLKNCGLSITKNSPGKMHVMSILKYFCPFREKPSYPILFHKKVLFHQWEHSKNFIFVVSPYHT